MNPVQNTQPLNFGLLPLDLLNTRSNDAHRFAGAPQLHIAHGFPLTQLPRISSYFVRIFLLSAVVLLISACATPVAHQTPSGKPEATISSADGALIKNLLISEMLDHGYSISSEREYSIAFDKPVENVLAAALLGSQYNSTPNARITYTVVGTPNGQSRVVAALQIVTNPGSPHERYADMTSNRDSLGVQAMLDRVRDRIEVDLKGET